MSIRWSSTKTWLPVVALALASSPAIGYFHFLTYLNGTGQPPALQRFDLRSLNNNTVPVLVSERGPVRLADDDSFPGLLSQIREATRVWNTVATSALKLRYAGLAAPDTPQNGPRVEIVFEEMPPGVLGLTRLEKGAPRQDDRGLFVPITRAIVQLPADFTVPPSVGTPAVPSYSERFFTTLVHELGHALGLQHSITGGAMSTFLTRTTTKARPLTVDDQAGVSVLYPTADFQRSLGVLQGRVTNNGAPVHLAAVVAVSPAGPVVSALTGLDGTYRIEGLPPGDYTVYTQPLPPPVGAEATRLSVIYPRGSRDEELTPSQYFAGQFYPNTQSALQAVPVRVTAGTLTDRIHFPVQTRSTPAIAWTETYSFPGEVAIKPGFIGATTDTLLLTASNVVSGQNPSDLALTILGDSFVIPRANVTRFTPDYLRLELRTTPFSSSGPRSLALTSNGDLFVAPNAFQVTRQSPPRIQRLQAENQNGRLVARLGGSGISAQTRVLFDGSEADFVSWDANANELLVAPPPAAGGFRANVVAFNPDGQSSLFWRGEATSFTYPGFSAAFAPAVGLTVEPRTLPAGTETRVEVTAPGFQIRAGDVSLGFGSADVQVRRVWVIGPDRVVANVMVADTISPGPISVSLTSGLQVSNSPGGLTLEAAEPQSLALGSDATVVSTGRPGAYVGGTIQMRLTRGWQDLGSTPLQVFVNNQLVPLQSADQGRLVFTLPASVETGLATVRVQARQRNSNTVALLVEPTPPRLLAVQFADGAYVEPRRPARAGDTLLILAAGLSSDDANTGQIRIVFNGVEVAPANIATLENQFTRITVTVPANLPVQAENTLGVAAGSRLSNAAALPLQ